jgi:DNA polymerase V
MTLFGLADCNNFYCSCERVFHPELQGKPVVVLSNNDGCVIARSEESKRLGLKMGDPFYQVRDILETNNVAVFSSNYTLYGSLSKRIMSILSRYTPRLDIYSIDEAFLDLSDMGSAEEMKSYGERISHEIKNSVGIPVSIGIAPTKTLAKIGSKYAKKYAGYKGCCLIDTDERRQKALSMFEIGDVWGIGRKLTKRLNNEGIVTAADFAAKSERWVKSRFNVTTLRTWKELNGISCISIDELPQKQSICTSRSFADQGISDRGILEEAVANFASRCAEKLRLQRSVCQSITVFAHTSMFRDDVPRDFINHSMTLPIATQSQAEIVGAALQVLRSCLPKADNERADRPSTTYRYKKAGVILWNISPERPFQQDFFDTIDREKQKKLTEAIDQINRKGGHNLVRLAVQGTDRRFELKREYISHNYTTDINDILRVKV